MAKRCAQSLHVSGVRHALPSRQLQEPLSSFWSATVSVAAMAAASPSSSPRAAMRPVLSLLVSSSSSRGHSFLTSSSYPASSHTGFSRRSTMRTARSCARAASESSSSSSFSFATSSRREPATAARGPSPAGPSVLRPQPSRVNRRRPGTPDNFSAAKPSSPISTYERSSETKSGSARVGTGDSGLPARLSERNAGVAALGKPPSAFPDTSHTTTP
mmetsp:Transcript_44557/g.106563  ORF Transcript_44557/g.106563 Transcript_44557/m.106563 type:complete len:216 (+) Transcript_44557:230-877(+)